MHILAKITGESGCKYDQAFKDKNVMVLFAINANFIKRFFVFNEKE